MHYEDDPEYLFSPSDGRSKFERNVIDELFPMNYSHDFNLGRITHKGRFGRIILVAKDGGSVLRSDIFAEVVKLDAAIKNFTIFWDDVPFKYSDLCAKSDDRCSANEILDFGDKMAAIESKDFFLEYPLWLNRDRMKAYFFPAYLGGVETDANKLITMARALNLMYFLDISVKRGDERAAMWEDNFIKMVDTLAFDKITVAKFVSSTLRVELESNTQSLVPFFTITVIIMLLFSIGTCMMADWVRSKPWLGLLGCTSAGLGVAASFGLCVYCGVDMIGINLAAPFLMLGVGMDDAFVLLAAWRRTSPSLSVSERLGHTYAEAAVSITITSITNFISFMIGTITPFPSVRIFCIYTSVAVLFTYIYHVTFFGGCMALFGHAEKRNLHGLICVPVMPKSLSSPKGYWYNLFCTGGINQDDPTNREDNKDHCMMIFFRDTVAVALNRPWVKVLVIVTFLIYLGVGIWGCTMVKEGLDRKKMSRDDSYSVKFYDYEDRYFREYPYRIQVVFNETLNYADPVVRNRVEYILNTFESSQFVANGNLTESWLRHYMNFIGQEESFIFLQGYNMSDQLDFNTALKNIFLRFPQMANFRNDVVFSEDSSEIIASRFVIQTRNVTDANAEKEMLIDMRAIADQFKGDKITIFNHLFIFFDQFILVRTISLQTIGVAALVMMVISLVFIPSPSCAIWVAFSIVSIEIGVVGYMTHWGVNLDSISMINLIMCIGFSVDFSAHISYAYISCEETTPAARVRSALYSLGLPIFQGSVSTILGIVALAFAPSYVFVTFFKTVFLVMLFGALHGVLLLPVLLALTDCCGGVPAGRVKARPTRSIDPSDKSHRQGHHNQGFSHDGQQPGGPAAIEHPFYLADKVIDSRNLRSATGGPIFIPRPSLIYECALPDRLAKYKYSSSGWKANDADSGQGSKSSASSEGSNSTADKERRTKRSRKNNLN
ncbi:Patched domain-containing protein 3 [Halotydeus destructor]|nr:Patched domain-containing protein 3 [Halotydeus destructor]